MIVIIIIIIIIVIIIIIIIITAILSIVNEMSKTFIGRMKYKYIYKFKNNNKYN